MTKTVTLTQFSYFCPLPRLFSGIQGPKDILLEDPRSLGRTGLQRRGVKDQGSFQGERHPPWSGRPAGVALASLPPAGAHNAPAARLLHLPL